LSTVCHVLFQMEICKAKFCKVKIIQYLLYLLSAVQDRCLQGTDCTVLRDFATTSIHCLRCINWTRCRCWRMFFWNHSNQNWIRLNWTRYFSTTVCRVIDKMNTTERWRDLTEQNWSLKRPLATSWKARAAVTCIDPGLLVPGFCLLLSAALLLRSRDQLFTPPPRPHCSFRHLYKSDRKASKVSMMVFKTIYFLNMEDSI
jgi:hypothetical protein